MSLRTFQAVTDGATLAGARGLRFLGLSEPTIHPQFDAFLDVARSAGLYTHLISNGSFALSRLAAARVAVGGGKLEVSLDAATGHTYERVRGRSPQYFARLTRALQCFFTEHRAAYETLAVSFVAHPSSLAEIGDFHDQWGPYVDEIRVRQSHSFNGTAVGSTPGMAEPRGPVAANATCMFYSDRMFVDYRGDAHLCNLDRDFALGPVRQPGDIVKYWTSASRRVLISTGLNGRCHDCERCSGLN